MNAHADGDTGRSPPPRMLVRPGAVRENAAAVRERFDGRVVGVTKATCGDPVVAGAMLDGGVDGVGDSRVRNLSRVGDVRGAETTLLRVPRASAAADVVAAADRSLVSEPAVVDRLGRAARQRSESRDASAPHDVILMVDVGDRREGVLPEDAPGAAARIADVDGVRLAGLGTNLGCFGGVVPTPGRLAEFVDAVERAEGVVDGRFDVVSGGSTVTLPLVEDGELPGRVNELRVGEAILLGTDVTAARRVPYLRGDAFELRAEVVECKRKPSKPEGPRGRNAAGERPSFDDRGRRDRAVLALGEQDAVVDDLDPLADGVEVLGASSDHTVLDVEDAARDVSVGDELGFRPGYRSLVRAFTSEYVHRVVAD
jgi:predicted amino acid racemase